MRSRRPGTRRRGDPAGRTPCRRIPFGCTNIKTIESDVETCSAHPQVEKIWAELSCPFFLLLCVKGCCRLLTIRHPHPDMSKGREEEEIDSGKGTSKTSSREATRETERKKDGQTGKKGGGGLYQKRAGAQSVPTGTCPSPQRGGSSPRKREKGRERSRSSLRERRWDRKCISLSFSSAPHDRYINPNTHPQRERDQNIFRKGSGHAPSLYDVTAGNFHFLKSEGSVNKRISLSLFCMVMK